VKNAHSPPVSFIKTALHTMMRPRPRSWYSELPLVGILASITVCSYLH
jgi:hypothetical protein